MSKRARITLDPVLGTEPYQDTEATRTPETEVHTQVGPATAADNAPDVSTIARGALRAGTIVKTVLIGLAVVSLVLLWKNRRP